MKSTLIQWCDSTVNPVAGCSGCELWTATNHTCYAGQLHQRFPSNPGFAPNFETPKLFPGRMADAARWSELRDQQRPYKPWLNGLPRHIFISDMGDALSEKWVIDENDEPIIGGVPFEYLKREILDVVLSPEGRRHVWQWLTKRPGRLLTFYTWLSSEFGLELPSNLWVGTSVTTKQSLSRVKQLSMVGNRNTVRFISVEPLWESIDLPPFLKGISWVIVGGESAKGSSAAEFKCEWARHLRDQCADAGVPYFLKQLGLNVTDGGERLKLLDRHGGDWNEWPEDLRVRQMPQVSEQAQ